VCTDYALFLPFSRGTVWQCRYQVDGNWQRESTKERDLDKAKAVAHDLLIDAI
jgi:hypothetical protein